VIAPSHIVVGQFAYFLAAAVAGHKPHVAEALIAATAALLPDLDKRDGMVGRWLPWISGPIEYWVGHRTATHSLLATTLIALVAWPLPEGYSLALIAGFASHPIADMMTPAGVAWFWPSRVRCVLPGNEKYRMAPMSLGELWFVIVIAVLTIPVAAVAQHGAGPLGTVRDMLGWFTDARTNYDAHKSEADWWLDVAGQDNHAFKPVQGKYRVIGPWQNGGLILETTAGPVTVCREGACDWYAERAVLVRGADEQTTTLLFKSKTTSTGALLDALSMLEPTGKVYLVGRLRAHVTASPPAVTVTGDNIQLVTLTYARPVDLHGWPSTAVYDVELIVQVRHSPGVAVPLVELREEEAGLSGKLSRHLP
jgi:inner membrane protein